MGASRPALTTQAMLATIGIGLAGCGESASIVEPQLNEKPVEAVTSLSSDHGTLAGVTAALEDALGRLLPVLGPEADTKGLQARLRKLADETSANRNGAARSALALAQAELRRFAASASDELSPDLAALELALDIARTLLEERTQASSEER